MTSRPVVTTVAVPDEFDLLGSVADPHCVIWLHRGEGLVGLGRAATIEVPEGPGRFQETAGAASELFASWDVDDEVGAFGSGPIAFGAFTFDDGAPGSALIVPEVVMGVRGDTRWMTVIGDRAAPELRADPPPDRGGDRIRYAGSSVSEMRWLEAVDEAVCRVSSGHLDKVVLARDLLVWSKADFDVRTLVHRLSQRFPECFTFSFHGLVGATPELLVRRRGPRVESLVLAGSAPRGHTPEEDDSLGRRLLGSAKDLDEHRPAAEYVHSSLAEVCSEVAADPRPGLLKLRNVQHLATAVGGSLSRDLDALQLAGRLHPTPAVCGTPTEAARETIAALEGIERSRYSGPVGWVDADGNGEWGIALRCAELRGSRGRLFAGAGIVRGSRPEAELEETRIKLRAMQSALEG